jgi:hypothetical protein
MPLMCITYLTVRTHTYICTHAYTHTYAHVCILPICIPKCPSVRIHWHLYNCSNHVMSCRQGTGQLVSSLQLDYVLSSVDRSFLHPHKLSSTTRSLHFYYLVLHSCLLCKHLVRRLYVLRALRTSAHTHMHTRANIHTNTRTHTHTHTNIAHCLHPPGQEAVLRLLRRCVCHSINPDSWGLVCPWGVCRQLPGQDDSRRSVIHLLDCISYVLRTKMLQQITYCVSQSKSFNR